MRRFTSALVEAGRTARALLALELFTLLMLRGVRTGSPYRGFIFAVRNVRVRSLAGSQARSKRVPSHRLYTLLSRA